MAGDPFATLGLERRFSITRREVEAAARARLATLHPDLAGGGALAEDDAEAQASAVNAAKRDLADPERRANALLALLGGPSASDDDSLPDGFLMEIMEARQAAEFADEGDAEDWSAWAETRRRGLMDEVGGLLDAAGAADDPAALAEARCLMNAWRYIERMREQLPGA